MEQKEEPYHPMEVGQAVDSISQATMETEAPK